MPYRTKMDGLKPLYNSMKIANRPFEHFQFKYSNQVFDCLFYIDTVPFEMLVGAVGKTWGALVKIELGFYGFMEDRDFYALCDLLNLKPSKGIFTSSVFLKLIADSAPSTVSPTPVSPSVLVQLDKRKRESINDDEKIYFVRWKPQGSKKAKNFQKTQELIGKAAAEFCQKHNISSCWSHLPSKEKPITMPWDK